MSMTALLWLALYCSSIVFSMVNPVFGALGYLLEYYMRPSLKWWGDAFPELRWNLIISIALASAFLIRRNSLRTMEPVANPAMRWQCAMAVVMTGVTFAVAGENIYSLAWAVQWIKMAIIFPALAIAVIRTRNAFDLFVVAHMLGALWWGYDAWLDPSRGGGRLKHIGSGDTLDDNGAAAHLLTVLPFAISYLLTEKDKRLRLVALLATPAVINTLILCNSRGSMVGLAAAIVASVFLIRSGYRLRLVGAGIGLLATVLLLADPQFIVRQQSTANYEEDNSAQQRLRTWQGAWDLIRDRPFGAGGRGFHMLSPVYIPDVVAQHGGDPRAPHNTWVMVTSEWGVLGLICFVGWYGSALLMAQRVKKRSTPTDRNYFYWRALAIQLAIVAFLVAGAFTDRLYAEAGYWMVALSYALYRIQRTDQVEASQAHQVPATAAPPGIQWESSLAHLR